MVKFEYLYRGLCGMANAPRAGSMAGHLGAAVVAGYFFGEDHPDLGPGVYAAIERDLNRIKTLYGFHSLLRFIEDPNKKARAIEQFGYLMA